MTDAELCFAKSTSPPTANLESLHLRMGAFDRAGPQWVHDYSRRTRVLP